MKRFVLVVTAVLLLATGAFGQARTAERVVDTPFSGLAPGLPDDSIRYVINGVPGTTPCQAGGTGALAVKVAGVWYCPRLTAGSGTGDVLGPSASSTGEMVLFADVTGKNIKRSNSLSGVALLTSGVVSTLSTTGTGNVVRAEAPTLVSAALLTPFIASFVNAGHTHDGGAGGGQLNASNVFSAGTIPAARIITGSLTASRCLRLNGSQQIEVAGADCGSGGLADPGSNGIIKRTALNVTAPAVAGTDYLTPTGDGSGLTGFTDSQIPNNITIDLATVATTANAGDSATAFFSSGVLEPAIGGTGVSSAPAEDQVLIGNGTVFQLKTLPSCSNATADKLLYNSSTNAFTCGADQTTAGGSGITTLNTLTGATQTFSKTDDTNITLTITSSGTDHNFALGFTGTLADARVADNITLTNITQITNRAIGDTSGDLAASRVDDGGVAATQALFSGAGAAAGFRAIADADIPNNITIDLATTATTANAGDSATAFFSSGTLEKTYQNSATVYNDAANTWTTGAQDFGAATSLKVPTSAGAGPTASGLIAYDSTSDTLEYGSNTVNRIVVNTARSISTTSPLGGGGDLSTDRTFTCTTCTTNAAALTTNQLVIGGGSQAVSTLGSLGTTTTVLHGNAGGAPSFGAVSLTADVSGDLPFTSLVQASGASVLLGRGSAGGAGDFQEIVLGTGLSMSGTTLNASGSGLPATDTTSIVEGSGDVTKEIRFEVDGITTGTVRVITAPDSNTTLPIMSQVLTFSGPTQARTYTLPDANATLVAASRSIGTTSPITGGGDLSTDRTIACATCVTSAASLTSTALVTGAGSQGSQTANANATMDASGNISTPGTITSGAGGSAAGALDLLEGTAPSLVANTFTLYAPTDVAAGGLAYIMPGAAATGFLLATNSSGVMTLSHVASSGTGNVALVGSPSLTTPIIGAYTVATLPAAGTANRVAIVTDAATAGSCTSGSGSARAWCRDTGSVWESIGDGGSGGGTINSGATNVIPKYVASTTIDDSLLSDDGTTLAYSGTGGMSLSGTGGGYLQLTEGSAPSLVANTVQLVAPADAAAGGAALILPGTGASGLVRSSNSAGTMTLGMVTITGTTNEIGVTNGDGVAGNPTIALASTLNLTSKTVRVPNSTTLPGSCAVGDMYMDTDATTGQRFYLCESTNTWALQGDGGGGGGANVSLNNLSGVAINTTLVSDTDNTDDLGTGSIKWRSLYVNKIGSLTGNGFVKTSGGDGTLSVDTAAYEVADADLTAVAGLSATGLIARTGAGTASARTITGTSNEITVTNGDGVSGDPTLALASVLNLSSKTLRIPNSTTLPANCAVGDAYMDTDATSGQRFYLCQATDTWILQGDGGSGANTALSNLAAVAINTTLVSDTTNTDDLGSSSVRWKDLYLAGVLDLGGTGAGYLEMAEGTAPSAVANRVTIAAPTDVQAGGWVLSLPTGPGTDGYVLKTNGSGVTSWVAQGSGASTALSNLAAVAINTTLISDTDVTDDLGSGTVRWRDIYSATHRAGSSASDILNLQARDVDGAFWQSFFTLTSGDTPTGDLNSSVTIGGNPIVSGGSSASLANVTLSNAGALRTTTTDTQTALVQAYDVDGTAYVTFLQLTAGNTPTLTVSEALTWADNKRQTFNPGANVAGINIGAVATAPDTLVDGDLWYDSTGNKFKCRQNGSTVDCISAGGGMAVGTTPITGGTATRLLYETSGNVLGEISGATSDGTTLTVTSPKVITSINDTNANELIRVTATGSATNEITIANAANSGSPTISTTGTTDANINLTLAPKGTGSVVIAPATAATGILSLADTDQSHYLSITPGSNITADRTFTITTGDASRTLSMSGNITTANDLITSGNFSLTLTTTASTNVTLPTSGTLATNAAATETASGLIEIATAAETTTGTDNTRAVSPDGLAGSTIFGVKVVQLEVFSPTMDAATGDGKVYFRIPPSLNGMNLVGVAANVITAGTTGTINIDIARCATAATGNVCSGTVSDVLSTNITIDSGENSTDNAAAAAVIDTANDDVATGQIYRIDVDAIHTTPSKGLVVVLTFQLP